MKREDLADLTKEQVDNIMKLHGLDIQEKDKKIEELTKSLNEATEKVTTYEKTISEFNENAKDNEDWKAKYDELNQKIAEQDEKRKAEELDKALTTNILSVFGDRKFTSEYAKNGLLNDIKAELNKVENKGKGINEIFETLTKDSTDIFVNPNQVQDMAGMGDSVQNNTVKKETPLIW